MTSAIHPSGRANTEQIERTRAIMKAHPEIKELIGNMPSTSLYAVAFVALQLGMAYAIHDAPWWMVPLAAYCIGAIPAWGCVIMVHECDHNLVFKRNWASCLLSIFANLPLVMVMAISDRIVHLRHHLNLNDPELDITVPREVEARLVGGSVWRKGMWLFFWQIFEGIRVSRYLKKYPALRGWLAVNIVVQIAFNIAVVMLLGWAALFYLFLSFWFGTGLHPVGARAIQEHMADHPGQQTYSYYGPLNWIYFNYGYHAEHHDLMKLPSPRLPLARKLAPEFYDNQVSYRSYFGLLWRFLRDPAFNLYGRGVSK